MENNVPLAYFFVVKYFCTEKLHLQIIPRQLGNGTGIKMIYPCCMGMIYPCSVGLIDILCICVCQHVHVVKAVSSKFVSYNVLKMVLQ